MTDDSKDPFIGGLRRGETAASHFTIIANLAARDPRMSLPERGLFTTVMSYAEGWTITESKLATHCRDGVKTIRKALLGLRDLGYMYRGTRSRYPAGTVNAKGKDISGALGPYEWFVTDKPDEIAVILSRYAVERRAKLLDDAPEEPAGEDCRPDEEVAPDEPVDNSPLPPEWAGSADQGKQPIPAGGDLRPVSAALTGRTKEDPTPEEQELEEQKQGRAGASASEPTALRLAGPETSTAASVSGPDELDQLVGDQQNAGARENEDPFRHVGTGALRSIGTKAALAELEFRKTGRPTRREQRKVFDRLDPETRANVRADLEATRRRAAIHVASPDARDDDQPSPAHEEGHRHA